MRRLIDLERMPARISGSLQRKLSLYALAAGAAGVELLALSQPAEGEVVYTPAHEIVGRNQSFGIDLNHDGIMDFTIENEFRDIYGYEVARLQLVANAGGAAVRSNYVDTAAVLPKGALIGPRKSFRSGFQIMADRFYLLDGGTYSYGNWVGASDQYLGFRFKIDGQIHYGWARMTTAMSGWKIFAKVSGYAYETEADTPIAAGDTGNAEAEEGQAKPTGAKLSGKAETTARATLGEFARGAPGIVVWRREPSEEL